MMVMVVSGCGKTKTAEEYIEASNLKSAELESYEMKLEMNMSMSAGGEQMDMTMSGTASVFQNPMRLKMDLATRVMEQDMQLIQYMEQTEGAVTIYQNVMGQWQKMVLDDPALVEMMSMNPADSIEAYMNSLISAEILREEKVNEREAVVIEMVMSGEMYEEILGQMGAPNLGGVEMDESFFAALGDLKATVWVDKKTDDMLKMSMDLSENMANMVEYMIQDGSLGEEELEALKGMKMNMVYEMLNQNNAAEFEIPEEALNAPELKL